VGKEKSEEAKTRCGAGELAASGCGTGPFIGTAQEEFRRLGRRAARATLARRYAPHLGAQWPRSADCRPSFRARHSVLLRPTSPQSNCLFF
jgi:hypothetical protein